ncbi:aldehyde dehydrogenase family protein [Acidisphaera sp. L21]|uniref:aldehyde dehydrogenase family protein n=1 Tax=Acidisphaera sp. L21 TaxID=1641851 RepID=UPI00131EC6AC|nr:aldehyde dehydrogenase family protein [Acidisphaera sp. L21]
MKQYQLGAGTRGQTSSIVLDDADIDQAVKGAISGIVGACGQTCMAGSRLLLHEAIHDAFVGRLRSTSFTTLFGGYKNSAIGREGGTDAIKEYLQTKSVWITTRPNRANPVVLG